MKKAADKEERIREALNTAADIRNRLFLEQRDAAREAAEEVRRLLDIERALAATQAAAHAAAIARSSLSAGLIAGSAGLGPVGAGGFRGSAAAQNARIAVLDNGQLIGTRAGIGGEFTPNITGQALQAQGLLGENTKATFQAEVNLDGQAVGSALGHSVQDGG